MQTVIIVNLWHIFALLRYQTSNGRDRALNWMLVEFTAWVHSNAQEIAVHVAIIDFLQVWTTGKKIARPDDVTVKIRNQQHEQVPGVSKCANATRHLNNFANKLLKQKHLCVTDKSTCCAVWQKAEFQFAFSKCVGSLAWHFSRILGQKSKATIPPKSYASRFLRHFSQHVIEVDEVGHSNNLDGLGGNRGKRPWFWWFLMMCWSYINFIQFLESRNVWKKLLSAYHTADQGRAWSIGPFWGAPNWVLQHHREEVRRSIRQEWGHLVKAVPHAKHTHKPKQ